MSVIDQLVDMGFDKVRAEHAHSVTGGSIEAAMEWLIAHEGEELPAPAATAAATTEGAAAAQAEDGQGSLTEQTPGSYKCNDCGKLFRDENGMMFHASKSGHENFSESTEAIKPLTEEERKQKAADLRDRIRAARAVKEENERKENLEKERRRREDGKKMLETREKQKENELRAIADERRRQKVEDQAARQRVLDQIKLDKEARKARQTGVEMPKAVPESVAPPPKVDYAQAMIQIRLPSGEAVKNTFGAGEQLSAVRLWLEMHHPQPGGFQLMTPFPRKTFNGDDYDTPLKELGLVPSANIVMTRSG